MPQSGTLTFPKLSLELVEDLSPADDGFLRLIRRRYRLAYPDGTRSAPFLYDAIDRAAIDAVVIAAHFLDAAGSAARVSTQRAPPSAHIARSRPLTAPRRSLRRRAVGIAGGARRAVGAEPGRRRARSAARAARGARICGSARGAAPARPEQLSGTGVRRRAAFLFRGGGRPEHAR